MMSHTRSVRSRLHKPATGIQGISPVGLLLALLSAALPGWRNCGAQVPGFQRWDTVAVLGMDGSPLGNPWAGGLTAPQFSQADLDGDGIDDLFVFDRSGHRILAFQGCPPAIPNGQPVYHHRPDWRPAFPGDLRNWALMRDANCDGTPDLLVNSQSGMRIWYGEFADGLVHYPQAPTSNQVANWDFGTGDQQFPLVCLSTDIPAIDDFDGDGDLDIVTWTETSSTLYSYTGRGADEGTVGCGDTLVWDVTNRCYGMLDEASEDNSLFIGADHECDFNVEDPRGPGAIESAAGLLRHAGGTTALLELDGDGHLDLLLGDVSYNQFNACYMVDAVDGQDSTISVSDQWPADLGFGEVLDIQRFPAGFPIDVDQDGTRDLVVAPNATFEVDGIHGAWWYRNAGTDAAPVWSLETTALLQQGMIDVGRGAYPATTDFNGDGLTDLVVANKERYLGPGNTPSLLARFENIGTADAPAFAQVDTNWLALPDYGLESVAVCFGDLDGDGDDDLIIGDELGNLHRWNNQAGPGAPMDPVLVEAAMVDAAGMAIDVGQFATPCLHDLDGDGDLDLLVGEKNGNLNLFENTGNAIQHEFTLVTANAGQFVADNLLGINGFSVPVFWPSDTGLTLVVGNELGRLQLLDCPSDPLASAGEPWPEITAQWLDLYEGEFAAPALADLDADGHFDLLVGVRDGGLTLWNGHSTAPAIRGCTPVVDDVSGPEAPTPGWIPAPNPLSPGSRLAVPGDLLLVRDLLGRPLGQLRATRGVVTWPVDWAAGTYLVQPVPAESTTGAPTGGGSARRLVISNR